MVKFVVSAVVVAALAEKFLTPIVSVYGESMFPTYTNRDYFLSHRIFNHQKLKKGDVVVLKDPSEKKYLVKRIYAFQLRNGRKSEVYVLGDNAGNSRDSREFGWIPIEDVVFVAWKSRPKRG